MQLFDMLLSRHNIRQSLTDFFFTNNPNLKIFLEKSLPDLYHFIKNINQNKYNFQIYMDQNITKLFHLLDIQPTGDAKIKSDLTFSQHKYLNTIIKNNKFWFYITFDNIGIYSYIIISFYIQIDQPIILSLSETTPNKIKEIIQPYLNDCHSNLTRGLSYVLDIFFNNDNKDLLSDCYLMTFTIIKQIEKRIGQQFLLPVNCRLNDVYLYKIQNEQLFGLIMILETFQKNENIYYQLLQQLFPNYDIKPIEVNAKYQQLIKELESVVSNRPEYGFVIASKVNILEDLSKTVNQLLEDIRDEAEQEAFSNYYINNLDWIKIKTESDPTLVPVN